MLLQDVSQGRKLVGNRPLGLTVIVTASICRPLLCCANDVQRRPPSISDLRIFMPLALVMQRFSLLVSCLVRFFSVRRYASPQAFDVC